MVKEVINEVREFLDETLALSQAESYIICKRLKEEYWEQINDDLDDVDDFDDDDVSIDDEDLDDADTELEVEEEKYNVAPESDIPSDEVATPLVDAPHVLVARPRVHMDENDNDSN